MRFKIKTKTLLLFFAGSISIIALARFCHHQTAGFQVVKIQHNLIDATPPLSSTEQELEFLNALSCQKFVFLGRGLQSFAFVSEDNKYVLKVFNNRYQNKISLFSLLTHFPWIGNWACARSAYYQKKLAQTFNSYQIAFSEMKDQTGLLYLHLFPTSDLRNPITLVDKLNISHSLDPNQTGFVIQKRAELVFPELKKYVNNHNLEGAKQALASLVDLFFWKWRHAIHDNDPLIRTNYGFIDGKAIQIDIGPLSKDSLISDLKQQQAEIQHITASLKFWLTENSPELIPFLDRELQEQLSLGND